MKFIHTADWHLGNSLFQIDRTKEFEQFLIWLKEQIIQTKADALIVSGDIFDTALPSIISRTQYNDFLVSLLDTDCKNVIIIGGNHDSGALLDSQKKLFNALNIHVVGSVNNLSAEQMVFPLKDKNQNLIGVCAAVPFAREIELRRFYNQKVEQGTLCDCAYKNLYSQVLKEAKKIAGQKNVPLIATGHLYASALEGRFSGLEKEVKCDDGRRTIDDVIGNLGSVHVSTFPEEFSYVALGHIHYTTLVAKNPKIRYSGSPFVLGFDEAPLSHNILLVETQENENELNVQKIQVPRFFDYKRIAGTISEIKTELKNFKNPPEKPTYIELYYKRELGLNIDDELSSIKENLPQNVQVVNQKVQNENGFQHQLYDMSGEELKNLSSEEIFKNLILSKVKFDSSGLTQEQIEQKQNEIVKKYLPLFMQVEQEIENGEQNENS